MYEERFTPGEERANFISHLVGASIALAGLVVLVVFAALQGKGIHVVSAIIFGTCMLLVYLFSAIYHGLRHKRAKRLFFLFDQMGIYLMIAGSYTPITLIALHGTLGWVMFSIEWGLAIIGILHTALASSDHYRGVHPLKIASYVVMGWLLLIGVGPLVRSLSPWGIALLFAGGGFYTLGIFFFSIKKRYSHLIWHLFVICGTACHYIMVFRDILPLRI